MVNPQMTSEPLPSRDPRAGETVILRTGSQAQPIFAWLIEVRGKRPGQLHRLGIQATSIGRAEPGSPVDIALDDTGVSAMHAEVVATPGVDGSLCFSIADRRSTNGTHVNGERVTSQVLVNNDQIELGTTVLIFKQL